MAGRVSTRASSPASGPSSLRAASRTRYSARGEQPTAVSEVAISASSGSQFEQRKRLLWPGRSVSVLVAGRSSRGAACSTRRTYRSGRIEVRIRTLTSIEINGTDDLTFKPNSWRKWRDETPDDFVFAVKASRYVTNRRVLAEARAPIQRFLGQGLTELGSKLGPINWQFATTKKFDAEDFGAFLSLLPNEQDGVALRHAVEVRHPSFASAEFYDLARKHGAENRRRSAGKAFRKLMSRPRVSLTRG